MEPSDPWASINTCWSGKNTIRLKGNFLNLFAVHLKLTLYSKSTIIYQTKGGDSLAVQCLGCGFSLWWPRFHPWWGTMCLKAAQTKKKKRKHFFLMLNFSQWNIDYNLETFLLVWWFRLRAPNTGGMGWIPGQGTKILHAAQRGQERESNWRLDLAHGS